jgi:hypothetical protein
MNSSNTKACSFKSDFGSSVSWVGFQLNDKAKQDYKRVKKSN